MLIPISFANFASTKKKIHRMKPSMIQLHTRNGDGVPICSAQFKKKSIKLPSEQLIQISLAIWAMNVSILLDYPLKIVNYCGNGSIKKL